MKNKIVGTGFEEVDQIVYNPNNWRIHPKHQQKAIEEILDDVGWVQNVIVNKRTGNLVDGHLRVQIAAMKGEESVPVVYVDLSEEEEKKIVASFDPVGDLAVADKEKLNELLEGLDDDFIAHVIDAGIQKREEDEILGIENIEEVDDAAIVTCPNCGHEFVL